MSNIYIQEPPTSAKVILTTTLGDIDLELWTREAPKACRNFIQLCMEGYYNGTIFHRVVKGFIVQGGDPTGTGQHGESIYGAPFKDEFHTRLRFCRRGLLAMANAGKNDNGSQFFFTLSATPELQNKHTIFGKVTGETIYNMLKLEEVEIDENEKPLYPQKIIKAEVLLNPFTDIIPRSQPKITGKIEKLKIPKTGAIKNFKLLSFGQEAEEDEKEFAVLNVQYSGISKSAHDNLSDPKLSSEYGVITEIDSMKRKYEDSDGNDESDDNKQTEEEQGRAEKEAQDMKKRIINKLHEKKSSARISKKSMNIDKMPSSDEEYYFGKDRDDERKRQVELIKKEIKDLKRSVKNERKNKETMEKEKLQEEEKKKKKGELINEYMTTQEKYKEAVARIPKKGACREQYTLQLLTTFRTKLKSVKAAAETNSSSSNEEKKMNDNDSETSWMTHILHCKEENLVLAKDASKKDDDWFEIYDPRNPINKRRRGEKVNLQKGTRSYTNYK